MKPKIIKVLLIGLLLGSGCDQPTRVPTGSATGDFLAWMQTMTKVRVTYSGFTDLQVSLKQGTLDPGHSSEYWLPREMVFSNWDSSYSISWQDSEFETKSCFVFRQIDPSFTLSSDCSGTTTIRGVYHSSTNTISDIYCMFRSYRGGSDPNNYQEQDATLDAPVLDLESFGEDSIAFTMKPWEAGSLSLGYNYDEHAYATYMKQMKLLSFDQSGASYPNTCRIVFSAK